MTYLFRKMLFSIIAHFINEKLKLFWYWSLNGCISGDTSLF